ncbi:S8 family peptidase [Pseudoalteromonas citrea]|nr:S8 family serine peptidase [Pseudoalteromonas citrea]
MRRILFIFLLFSASLASNNLLASPIINKQNVTHSIASQRVESANNVNPPPKKRRMFIELHSQFSPPSINQDYGVTHSTRVAARTQQQVNVVNKLATQLPNVSIKAKLTKSQSTLVAELSPYEISVLSQWHEVKNLYPSYDLKTQITQSNDIIKADKVWHLNGSDSITGKGITIAIIDTGVDYNHPDLGGCLGSSCKVRGGYDFVNQDTDPMDDSDHGTHVAGIISANGKLRGVAPDSSLIAYKVCDENGACPDHLVIEAIEAAIDPDGDPNTDDKVDIINLSLGSPFGAPDSPLSTAVNAASEAGILVVAAAGNEGSKTYTIGAPANAEQAITVAASYKTASIADFSSRGYILENGHAKPEVTAPGVNINSTVANNQYQQLSGTSMAAPMVAGTAALLLSNNDTLSSKELKSVLMANADNIWNAPFNSQGAGIVDALQSAQVKVISDQGIINLGWYHNLQSSSLSKSLKLRNISNINQSIDLSIRKNQENPISYNLSSNSISTQSNSTTEIQLTIEIPATLAVKPRDDVAYIAWLDIKTGSAIQSIPITLLHGKTIKVSHPDFSDYEIELQLIDKKQGLVSTYLYAGNKKREHTFISGSGDFAINFKAQSTIHNKDYLGAKLNLTGGELVAFSLSDNWHPVEYDISLKNGKRLDEQGKLNYPLSIRSTLVLPEYGTKFNSFQASWFDRYSPNVLHILPPTNEVFYDTFIGMVRKYSKYKDQSLALSRRLSTSNIQSNGSVLFELTQDEIIAINFAYAKQGNKAYDLLTPFTYFSHKFPNKDLIGSGSSFVLDNPIQLRQMTMSTRLEDDFSYIGESQTYSNSNEKISSADDIAFSTALYKVNRDKELELTNFLSKKPWLKKIPLNNEPFNFKVGLLLPAFKAKMVEKEGIFTLSYDNANSTGLFSDNLLTIYQGQVQYTTEGANATPNKEIKNNAITIDDMYFRPKSLYVMSTSNGSRFEFNRFAIDETPVSLIATLEYDLSAADFSPPVINELTINTLGGEHVYLAQGTGEISLKVSDESIESSGVYIKESNAQDWKYLAGSTTDTVTGKLTDLAVGSYDLKIESMDTTGNKLTYTAKPAFFSVENCKYDKDCDGYWNQFDEDADNDGVNDDKDSFPLDPSEWLDTDGDTIGNNTDDDDDNDNYADSKDKFPLDASEWLDTDHDGIGNNADTDDDNDGYADSDDAFPLDTSEWLDSDGDGIGNNADTDDDNDGIADSKDLFPLDANRSSNDNTANQSNSPSSGSLFWLIPMMIMVVVKNELLSNKIWHLIPQKINKRFSFRE